MVLEHPGVVNRSEPNTSFISMPDNADEPVKPDHFRLIPYFAWANRDEAAMQVWIPYGSS